jgi:hypothetical protein
MKTVLRFALILCVVSRAEGGETSLPVPSGPHPVGTATYFIVDLERQPPAGDHRGRPLAVQACRTDDRFGACVSLDGFSFGRVRDEGVGAPAMFVKAEPEYSDEDLAKRGRTREEWDAMAEQIGPELLAPLARNQGGVSYYVGIKPAGHLSFSDAPFVMPDTISRFGGAILEPARVHHVLAAVVRAFLVEQLLGQAGRLTDVSEPLPEVKVKVIEVPARASDRTE